MAAQLRPDPLGELTALPQTPSCMETPRAFGARSSAPTAPYLTPSAFRDRAFRFFFFPFEHWLDSRDVTEARSGRGRRQKYHILSVNAGRTKHFNSTLNTTRLQGKAIRGPGHNCHEAEGSFGASRPRPGRGLNIPGSGSQEHRIKRVYINTHIWFSISYTFEKCELGNEMRSITLMKH